MDALTEKRRDVRHLLDRQHELQAELSRSQPGPGYYDAKLALEARIETARQNHTRAVKELAQLQNGTQTTLPNLL